MKSLLPVIFLCVLGIHFWLVSGAAPEAPSGWASYDFEAHEPDRVATYLESAEYWLGLSYALAVTFAGWCFLRVLKLRRESLGSSAAGLTLGGVLFAGICFLTGCCGSPMLPIYLGLFGGQFLSVTKPLTFVVTLLSILVGYAWMLKKAPSAIASK